MYGCNNKYWSVFFGKKDFQKVSTNAEFSVVFREFFIVYDVSVHARYIGFSVWIDTDFLAYWAVLEPGNIRFYSCGCEGNCRLFCCNFVASFWYGRCFDLCRCFPSDLYQLRGVGSCMASQESCNGKRCGLYEIFDQMGSFFELFSVMLEGICEFHSRNIRKKSILSKSFFFRGEPGRSKFFM